MRNWFFTDYQVISEKNGVISVRRRFGDWWIAVNGCGQTSQYTYTMWVEAFRRLRRHTPHPVRPVRNVLMLGLGGGGQIRTIYTNFPGSSLTVVEYDPTMITLAKELKLWAPYAFPKVLEGNAAELVPQLQETYDLILLDLFSGPEPSPLATDVAFAAALKERLAPAGLLLANVYKRTEYLDSLANTLIEKDRWMFRENNLGLFSLF